MKYDLLFSDIVAFVSGLIGLMATAIVLQKALLHWSSGAMHDAAAMVCIAVFLLVWSRKFLVARAYESILHWSYRWMRRPLFLIVSAIWLVLIFAAMISVQPYDLLGVSSYAPWLFSPQVFAVFVLFFSVVYLFPGLAFRPYGSFNEPLAVKEKTRGAQIAQAIENGSNAVRHSPYPRADRFGRVASLFASLLILTGIGAFMFTRTHASAEYLASAKPILFLTTFLLFLGFYLPRNYGTRIIPATGAVLFGPIRKLVNATGLMALSFAFAHLPYMYTIPWVYNNLVTTQTAEIAYRVTGKVDYKVCRDGVGLAYVDYPSRTFHLCRLEADLIARLSEGDVVYIRGPVSFYGHTAETLRLRGKSVDL